MLWLTFLLHHLNFSRKTTKLQCRKDAEQAWFLWSIAASLSFILPKDISPCRLEEPTLPPELQPPQLVMMVQRDLLHTGLKSHTSATQRCTRDKGQAFLGVFYSYTVLQTPAPEQDINNKSADMHIICKEFSNRTPTIKHCMNSCVMGWMKLVIKKKYFECSVRVVTCYLKPECVFAWNRNAYVPMFR